MKRNKILLIVQTVLMYVVELPMAVMILLFYLNIYGTDTIMTYLILSSVIGNLVIVFPLGILNFIFALIGLFKGMENPYEITFKVKLVLIPWYMINFFFGFMLFAAMLNPFLMMGIPVLIFIMCSITYIYTISTSLADYAYTIRSFIKRNIKKKGIAILAMIFLAMFCLDVIGSGLICYSNINGKEGE